MGKIQLSTTYHWTWSSWSVDWVLLSGGQDPVVMHECAGPGLVVQRTQSGSPQCQVHPSRVCFHQNPWEDIQDTLSDCTGIKLSCRSLFAIFVADADCSVCEIRTSSTMPTLKLGVYSYFACVYMCTVSETGVPHSQNSDNFTVTVVGEPKIKEFFFFNTIKVLEYMLLRLLRRYQLAQ